MKFFWVEANTQEELEAVQAMLNQVSGGSVSLPEKKTAKSRSEINRQNYERRKAKQSEQSEIQTEEREEKEEVSPLSSPSSLPSSPSDSPINYPITPFLPPLPEEKGEREEDGSTGNRGDLMHIGPFVQLTPEEHQKLQKKFGEYETQRMIANMNNYIGEDPKRQKTYSSRNHYLTLLNWKRRDEDRKQAQAKPQQKTYSFAEVGEMMRRGEL